MFLDSLANSLPSRNTKIVGAVKTLYLADRSGASVALMVKLLHPLKA